MELVRELIRVLYHLDLFRRHVRNGESINLHGIKELFSTLSDAMRNPLVQPQTLTKILQGSALLHELEEKSPADAYNIVASNLLQEFSVLATNYSLTKVCLTCSTCSHEENVVKFFHHVDSSLISSSDYPSFEFSLKTSLNTNEFCQRINCFGELKIFRVLKQEPSIIVLDFEQGTQLTSLPSILKPYLVFNSTSSSELYLTSVLLNNPPATLFYHTRLFTWIYTNEDSIISLNTSDWSQVILEPLIANNTAVLAFYTYCYPNNVLNPPPSITPIIPIASTNPIPAVPVSTSSRMLPPPPLSLHHQNSTTSLYNLTRCPSNVSSITNASSSSLMVASSPISTSSPCPLFLPNERIYENWPLDNDSGHGSIEPNNSLEDGSCSGSSSSSSGSSRNSASTAISNKNKNKVKNYLEINSKNSCNNNNISSIYSSSKTICGSSCPTTPSKTTQNNANINNNGMMMNYATIKRRRYNRTHSSSSSSNRLLANGLTSVSVPDLTLDFKKAVSFNCKVTLVDDCNDEEYIPHPIFEKVLEKMRKQN